MKFVPVNVTDRVAPCSPDDGSIAANVGDDELTVKVTAPLVPLGVLTVTLRAPLGAAGIITRVAVSDVPLTTVTEVPVTPVPLIARVVAPKTKFVPVNVTGTLTP
jgi:hypothetical protein